ncbi:MAG TPA: hypothetical protein ENG10_00850 [Candidatus Bathyarchaeota archaeon]|nr:hypothetical protein [Candidatus Bathyarchaeota archaeon]HEX68830.1 hypothetical protein [Candidatus Bathyarchaeota archaeon]
MKLRFIRKHKDFREILMNHKLANLGDAYVNFIYSLALSNKKGEPVGRKVRGKILAEAFKRAELRKFLPHRIDSHAMADAAEALILYAWATDAITTQESIKILEEAESAIEGFKRLLVLARRRLNL